MSWISNGIWNCVERRLLRGHPLDSFNRWQAAFCEWNAERLGIPAEESRERFSQSWAALPGGHRGRAFRVYGRLHMEVCRPFWGNSAGELPGAYAAHEPIQFLRLLSYREPELDAWPELRLLENRSDLTVVDFGCGLAQFTTAWVLRLREQGKMARLWVADLPLLHLQFLEWLFQRWAVDANILECTVERPIPALPACDLCVATEVLEHVAEPLTYLRAFADSLKPGGLLLTNLEDHEEEFLHVSTNLGTLRAMLETGGWSILRPNRLYQKPF